MAAETLYRERRLSVSAIAQKLHVSKSTLYSYLRHRGVEIGPYKKLRGRDRVDRRPKAAMPKAATILLSLRTKNISKFVCGEKRATEDIERYCLEEFNARRLPGGEYELTVPYSRDEDLDQTMEELLGDIASQADDRNCFSESDAHLSDADRHWG
jgi:hypothetical protein